jgi:hypothetical protein
MTLDRRDFVGRVAAGAMLAGLPLPLDASLRAFGGAPAAPAPEWDLSWVNRIKGKYRAVFDVPEIESGYGVWRASLWGRQYHDVLGVKFEDMTPVLVLRHNGIVLAMQQAFWDRYAIGKEKNVRHPITEEPTDRNPALLASSRGEVPADLDAVALDKFLARGGIALACNLALQDVIDTIMKKDGAAADAARNQAIASMVPGVILQPSGVFAALHAQDAGCKYLRAS